MKKLLGILLFISIALSANAQLLWKVSGKGLEKPSYIFGTYHLSPLSIKDSIAAMPQAMSETAQVYGEVVMSEMATPAFMQSMQQQMMMPKDTTLQSLFTPEQYEEVGKAIKENMMVDIAMLAQLKPAAINQQLVVLLYMKPARTARHLLPAAGRTARQESWRSGNSPVTNRHSVQQPDAATPGKPPLLRYQ